MSEKRFQKTRIVDKWGGIYDSKTDEVLDVNDVEHKLNEQQATITEYEDFCYNLCMFIIGKDLDDEFREKYGKEYKIITKWKGCGSDEV